MDEKPIVPINCFFQGCRNPAYEAEIRKGKEKCFKYNQLSPDDRAAQSEILKELLGKMGKDTVITPPFWCDYGYNISIGDYFYSNHGMIITDGAKVTFGDNAFVAPNCCFTTAEHAIDPLSAILSLSDYEKDDPRVAGEVENVINQVLGGADEGNR